MPLEKYKVLGSSIEDSIAYLPEKAIPLGIWTLSESTPSVVTYKTNVAFMMKYKDWVEEFPDEAKEEEDKQKVEEEKKKGAPSVE